MIRAVILAAVLLAWPVAAQTIWEPLRPAEPSRQQGPDLSSGTTATLRALDKVSGHVEDITLESGGTARFGRLSLHLLACRFPADNPASDAYAFLEITDSDHENELLFRGWMIASSPALNALDHPRYDVWALHCT